MGSFHFLRLALPIYGSAPIQRQGDYLRRKILIAAFICCVSLCFCGFAAGLSPNALGLNQLKQSESSQSAATMEHPENITLLRQDSGTNLSMMNISVAVSPTYGSSQAVKFTAPKSGWKLENVLVMATDYWNASSKQLPYSLPFAIEIRDANLKLLYHFADIQLPYFTSSNGIRMANIEVPEMPISGDFFVCFYGYRSIGLVTEVQNATGNSYYFDKQTGMIYNGVLPIRNNKTLPVNWLIRVAGN